jgi:hypothetical protein
MYPAEFTKSNQLKHSQECTMAFGRKDMQCPRCVELASGAPSRAGWQRDHFAVKARNAEMDRAAIAAHFASGGPHATGKCGPVCTAFDY